MSPTPILEARGLQKRYPGVDAVRGVSLSIPEGVCFGLLGPNGAGKTTTVEMMEGVTTPSAGNVLYRGAPLGERFREEAGIQFQSTALQDFLTVRETLRLFARLYAQGAPIDELVRSCALEQILDRDTPVLPPHRRARIALSNTPVRAPSSPPAIAERAGRAPVPCRGFEPGKHPCGTRRD